MLDLTADQVADAEACGVSFPPATPQQVQRYAMQRKVFRIGGAAVLATRGGALFETAATLEHLIVQGGRQRRDLAEREREVAPLPAQPGTATPAPPPPLEVVGQALRHAAAAPSAAAPATGGPRRMPRGERWRTAGAERRGRLAQHWSLRGGA